MNIVFLDRYSIAGSSTKSLQTLGNYTEYEQTSPAEVVERAIEAEVLITNKVIIDAQIMDALPKLKLICVAATGVNNIDLTAAQERDISVRNVVNYSTKSVVQTTLSLLLALMQQISYYDNFVKSGRWSKEKKQFHHGRPFQEIAGMRWGIIGMGNIGQGVASIAQTLGAEVVYYSTSGKNQTQPYHYLTLPELLATSDIISIHAPLNEQTAHLIGKAELEKMKATAYLINVGRGGIVDEKALVEALDNDEIAGAGLDVFVQEPIEANHPLYTMKKPEKLIATPHIAWASCEARKELIRLIVKNIEEEASKW
ncbi:MAG: D-2-hydroxyacid dehydrogenase [Phocaeicola sp.]